MKYISKYFKHLTRSSNKENLFLVLNWIENDGHIVPPPIVKQTIIKGIAERNHVNILVETGTYLGEMVEAQKNLFRDIHSIELDEKLYTQAVKKFRPYPHIKIYHGDSKRVLPEIIKKIKGPALFWLDAHYSGGITARGDDMTPILHELEAIMKSPVKKHIILIDDASDFNGKEGYPTLHRLQTFVRERKHRWTLYVKDNIIRIYS